jgi:hypothetical protein
MKLLGCGDSWTWGDELVDPIEEPVPIMKLPNGFARHQKEVNKIYRYKHRYINILADSLNAELVDLSKCSASNETITRKLYDYLAVEGYLAGRDTSELFVSIGWTSPGRTEFYWKQRWGDDNYIPFGPWSLEQDHKDEDVNDFMKLYFNTFYHPHDYIKKWITTIFHAQTLLKAYKIKYVMHQAFFHPFFEHMHFWDDKQYKNKHIDNVLDEPTKKMWAAIDDKHFMHKEDEDASTFHHYVLRKANNDPEEVFEVFHPNAKGHGIWAEHMVNYITENKLCITI